MASKKWNPRSYHPELKLQVFEKKQQKENGMRKEGIHDLTIQSSVLQVFEQKAVKGKGDEKSTEKQESKIDDPKFICASTVLGQLGKTIDRISSRTMKRLNCLRMFEIKIKHVFVVLPAPSSTSTHPKFILGAV